MVHYKLKFSRPRPSQICPGLMPLLPVPGHASYPSGHSLMSHLTSLCLTDLAPWAEKSLTVMAERVARNREFAGLHYPSDSEAGRIMAEVIHDMLPESPTYAETFKYAVEEWASHRTSLKVAAE
jgi:acid phosphatase (class A)